MHSTRNSSMDQEPLTLHRVLHLLRMQHRDRTHEELMKIGITEGQPKIIRYLKRNNGCIQRELANNCHVKAPTVTSLLANMEKSGLIYRTTNSGDRRILNVFLTEKGEETYDVIEEIFCRVDEECFYGFSEEERESIIDTLYRLYFNMKAGRSEQPHD